MSLKYLCSTAQNLKSSPFRNWPQMRPLLELHAGGCRLRHLEERVRAVPLALTEMGIKPPQSTEATS